MLSLRHWAKNIGKNKFEIPNIQLDEEISSAFNYLKQSNIKLELETIYSVEEEYLASIKEAALEEAKVLAEEKAKVLAEEKAEVLAEEKAKVLAEEKAKVLAEEKLSDEKLKFFIELYKNNELNLEALEKLHGLNFSDVSMNKVTEYWGENDEKSEKLEYLKNYIGKKRNILSQNKNEI